MLKENTYKNNLLLSALICALLALCSIGIFIVQGGGAFTVVADFNEQQIPFTMGLHNALLDGGFSGWSWNADLGTSTLKTYSFYEMGSVFFYLSMLLPARLFPYAVGWIYMLKYVLAGVTAFMYISLFVSNKRYAVIGAVLYAFSGYQTINLMFYHFHDVTAVFPLLLYGLERCMEDRKKFWIFVMAVFINAVTNYFFFVQSVVFLVIYFLLRFWTKDFRLFLVRSLVCIGCGALGALMGAVILLPSVLYLMEGSRAAADLFFIDALVWETRQFLYMIKGMLLPAEPMCEQNSIYRAEWSSTSCYLPLLGMSFVFAYMHTKRDWLSRLLVVLIVISFSPLLTCGMLLFKGTYQRWWYSFVLIMALASSVVAENRDEYDVNYGLVFNAIALVVFCSMLMFMRSYEEEHGLVFHRVRFAVYAALAFFGLVYVWMHGRLPRLNIQWSTWLLAGVCAAAVLTTVPTLYFYRAEAEPEEGYLANYELGAQIELPDEQYRLLSADNTLLYTGSAAGTGSFSSTVSSGIAEFDMLFDYYNNIHRLSKDSIPGLKELLAAKYYLTEDAGDGALQQLSASGATRYLHETEACPIGFAADSYILYEQLMGLEREQRALALLDSVLIAEKDEELVSALLPHKETAELELQREPSDYAAECSRRAVRGFSRDGHGFSCVSSYDKAGLVWFSVPYDGGWLATVDGAETKIISSAGMMAIAVPGGEHSIVFEYSTPGFGTGLAMSLCGFAVLGLLCLVSKRRKEMA